MNWKEHLPTAVDSLPKTSAPPGARARRTHCKLAGLVLVALVYLCAAGSAAARHRSHASTASPGDFEYFLLSLSWSPAFCLSSPGAAQCEGPRRYGFIVHGLWPQNEQGWPENCDVHRPVSDEVVREMSDIMPARGLVYHEWSAHGTCSGLEPADYFALVRRAYAGIAIPEELRNPTRALEQAPAAITAAIMRTNPRFSTSSIVVTCSGQEAPRLREVHICLQRNLAPRDCSGDVLRGACRAPLLIVPPIR